MAENEQLRSAEAEQERKTENREKEEQEEERRFGEGEEDEEEAFSPLPESAEQVPKYSDQILIEHLSIFFQVADLLAKVENYTTAIPDSVTESVLNSAGLQSTDVQVEVFLSIKANFYFR